MSVHLLDHAHMDVASLRCRLQFRVQVLVVPVKFTISLCQICIPALADPVAHLLVALMIPGTVNLCLESWALTFQNFRGYLLLEVQILIVDNVRGFKMQPVTKSWDQTYKKQAEWKCTVFDPLSHSCIPRISIVKTKLTT
jgi:hypothetical protein